jgi:RES domain-containing protein
MQFWRISEFADLSGEGGLYADGRWHLRGTPVVYCSDHPSTALLEVIVHFRRFKLPDTYQLLRIEAGDEVRVHAPESPANWQTNLEVTRELGSAFVSANADPLMRIPSVVMPQAFNYLLNPAHPDATQFKILQSWRYPFDSRLLT